MEDLDRVIEAALKEAYKSSQEYELLLHLDKLIYQARAVIGNIGVLYQEDKGTLRSFSKYNLISNSLDRIKDAIRGISPQVNK